MADITITNNSGYSDKVTISLVNAELTNISGKIEVPFGQDYTFHAVPTTTQYFILGVNVKGQVRTTPLFSAPRSGIKYHEDLNVVIGNL
jgi:hypothetical protein